MKRCGDRRWMGRGLCLGAAMLAVPVALDAQDAVVPAASELDASALVPHRMRVDLGDFLSDVFRSPEVYISLERTHYYVDEQAREAIRVRWVANTHAHEDALVLDAETMSIIQAESLAKGIQDPSRVMAFVREDSITSVTLGPTGETSSVTAAWDDEGAFHLMMLPYLFAVLDPDAGQEYVLPSFSLSSGKRSTIRVTALGEAEAGTGQKLFRSEHGWVTIEWTIDPTSPPYLRRMSWHYQSGRLEGEVSDSRVVDWAVFDGDTFRDVVR